MESIIGLIIWVIVIIVIISRTIHHVPVSEKKGKEEEKKGEDLARLPVAVEAETVQEAEPVEELQNLTRELKRTPLPKDLRQAIILREIIGPPKGL